MGKAFDELETGRVGEDDVGMFFNTANGLNWPMPALDGEVVDETTDWGERRQTDGLPLPFPDRPIGHMQPVCLTSAAR